MNRSEVAELSKLGFTIIKNELSRGNTILAKEVAEALHNIPDNGNSIQAGITRDNIAGLLAKYPDYVSPSFQRLSQFVT